MKSIQVNFIYGSESDIRFFRGRFNLEIYPLSAVAQWIERATDNRVVARSNPTETAWKLWQFHLPHFASVFRKRH